MISSDDPIASAAGQAHKKHLRSENISLSSNAAVEYEFGRLIGSGMIGVVYLARIAGEPQRGFFCIKRMFGEQMAVKRLFEPEKTEIRILEEVKEIEGCI